MIEKILIVYVLVLVQSMMVKCQQVENGDQVLAWIEAPPGEEPPKLQKPPYYVYTEEVCRGLSDNSLEFNLCGDLNQGTIPQNPMGQNPLTQRYPFEFIRNKTLDYLRTFLPILKRDPRLPRVSKLERSLINNRQKRQDSNESVVANASEARAIPCSDSSNFLCRMWGMLSNLSPSKNSNLNRNGIETNPTDAIGMSTACPSMASYVTPLFARNYRGLWRYIVQIPFEGYLIQSVEITKCMNKKCSFMDGKCLSSSRWMSLLAAEIFYPTSSLPHAAPINPITTPSPHMDLPIPPVYDFQNFQQYLIMRAGNTEKVQTIDKMDRVEPIEPSLPQCDGIDQNGCFQLRMFYDWFLVPGACKCWRPSARQTLLRK